MSEKANLPTALPAEVEIVVSVLENTVNNAPRLAVPADLWYICVIEWPLDVYNNKSQWTFEAPIPRDVTQVIALINEIESGSAQVKQVLCLKAGLALGTSTACIDVTAEIARAWWADWKRDNDPEEDILPDFVSRHLPVDLGPVSLPDKRENGR